MDTNPILTWPLTTENWAVAIWNAISKFRDGFMTGTIDPTVWDITWRNQSDSIVSKGWNSSWAGYLRVSMSPYQAGSELIITSKAMWKMPHRFWFWISASQRILGQEFELGLVWCDADGIVDKVTPVPDMPILGTIVVSASVATINFATPHPYKWGDRVILTGNTDKRLNIWPVIVTPVTRTQITVPTTVASATYTAGGQVVHADYFDGAMNASWYDFENVTTTNASVVVRRNWSAYWAVNSSHVSTIATQASLVAYTDAFRSAGDYELISTMEYLSTASRSWSSTSATTGYTKITETIPDEEKLYKIQIRVKNLDNFNILQPCYITSASKSGTTTATVNTNAPHGLTTGDFVQIYGARDQTNFPNLASSTAVLSTPTTTSFTLVWWASATATTEAWVIWAVRWNIVMPWALNFSIQSFSVATDVLSVVLNTTVSWFLAWEIYEVVMSWAGAVYNWPYICMRAITTTVEFMKVDYSAITPIISTNVGGAIIRRTDYRLHFIKQLEYTRHLVELSNNRGWSDAGLSIPVQVASTIAGITTLTTLNTLQNLNGYQAHQQSIASEMTAWQTNVRNLLT